MSNSAIFSHIRNQPQNVFKLRFFFFCIKIQCPSKKNRSEDIRCQKKYKMLPRCIGEPNALMEPAMQAKQLWKGLLKKKNISVREKKDVYLLTKKKKEL